MGAAAVTIVIALADQVVYPTLTGFILALLISALLTGLLVRWAPRLGLLDIPDARKVHLQPVPRGGGLAIYIALATTTAVLPDAHAGAMRGLLALGLPIVLLGLADDWRSLPWQLRLGIQLAVAVAACMYIGIEAGPGLVVAVLWVTGLINAFNMLDNMDALSAGIAWIAAVMFALSLGTRPEGEPSASLNYVLLMGALAGFLWFNRPPARIFMGDAGSTFLGFFLATRSLADGFIEPLQPRSWAVSLCILAVPCYDLGTVVLLRLRQGRSPFHPDKQHLSHRLVGLGLSSPAAVVVIYLCGLASGIAGLALERTTGVVAILIGISALGWWCTLSAVEYLRHFGRR